MLEENVNRLHTRHDGWRYLFEAVSKLEECNLVYIYQNVWRYASFISVLWRGICQFHISAMEGNMPVSYLLWIAYLAIISKSWLTDDTAPFEGDRHNLV